MQGQTAPGPQTHRWAPSRREPSRSFTPAAVPSTRSTTGTTRSGILPLVDARSDRPDAAWVVSWGWHATPNEVSSRAFETERRAQRYAADLRARLSGVTVHVSLEDDLGEDAVYPLFVAHFGVEVRPGVVSTVGADSQPVELLVDPARIVRDAYMSEDVADDRDLTVVPTSSHPRRLGLMWLISDVRDAIDQLDPRETQLDLRG
jgi:hypothetical protein